MPDFTQQIANAVDMVMWAIGGGFVLCIAVTIVSFILSARTDLRTGGGHR